MKIQYSETQTEETSILLSESNSSLSLKGNITGDTYLSIAFPFSLNKIPPKYRDTSTTLEKVYVFRNLYFAEYDICCIRSIGDAKKTVGFLFKPTIIFNDDAEYLWRGNRTLQTAIFRSFLNFLGGNISLQPNTIKERREMDYLLEDFLPRDVIFGIFPDEWNTNFTDSYRTQLLLNLYLKGFFFLNHKDDEFFTPPSIRFQKDNYDLLVTHKTKFYKHLDLAQVSDKVTTNVYCSLYITNILKSNSNQVAKFHQVYALIEIFKDEVLKIELNEKICERRMASTISGNKILKEVFEISKDQYNISKLFTKYRRGSKDVLETLYLQILYFLEDCRDKQELNDLKEFQQVYYYLRNIIVHDLQFLFIGDKQKIEKLRNDFSEIIYHLEYLVLETLCHLNL